MDSPEQKKRAKAALPEDEKVRNYQRRLPVGVSHKRGDRLKPLL